MIPKNVFSHRAFLIAPFFAGLLFTAVKMGPDQTVPFGDVEAEARRGVSKEVLRMRREGARRFMEEYGDPTMLCIGKILPGDSAAVWRDWLDDKEDIVGAEDDGVAPAGMDGSFFLTSLAKATDTRDTLFYGKQPLVDSGAESSKRNEWISRAADMLADGKSVFAYPGVENAKALEPWRQHVKAPDAGDFRVQRRAEH